MIEFTHIAIFSTGLILGTLLGAISTFLIRLHMDRRREDKLFEHIREENQKKIRREELIDDLGRNRREYE